ncbi:hypothetical protein HYQ46_006739 [Verticillium longisporum]|nr:hypothetical protein HYQ46_006739 [Verticillium longisporum]
MKASSETPWSDYLKALWQPFYVMSRYILVNGQDKQSATGGRDMGGNKTARLILGSSAARHCNANPATR